MNRRLKMVVGFLVWCALFAYLLTAVRFCSSEQDQLQVKRIEVKVLDSASLKIITPSMVKGWLVRDGVEVKNREITQINTTKIESLVESRGFVKDAKVYVDLNGVLHIDLTQRMPIARVNTVNGYNFYITSDHYILPLQSHYVLYVPIVTGYFYPPFGKEFVGSVDELSDATKKKYRKNYEFFTKLINFVEFIGDDSFWNAQIVQINVHGGAIWTESEPWQEPQVEFIPRVGNHVVMLGELDNVPEKLDKLLRFYKNALRYEGWDSQKYINLRYRNQVVCTK